MQARRLISEGSTLLEFFGLFLRPEIK